MGETLSMCWNEVCTSMTSTTRRLKSPFFHLRVVADGTFFLLSRPPLSVFEEEVTESPIYHGANAIFYPRTYPAALAHHPSATGATCIDGARCHPSSPMELFSLPLPRLSLPHASDKEEKSTIDGSTVGNATILPRSCSCFFLHLFGDACNGGATCASMERARHWSASQGEKRFAARCRRRTSRARHCTVPYFVYKGSQRQLSVGTNDRALPMRTAVVVVGCQQGTLRLYHRPVMVQRKGGCEGECNGK